FSRVAHFEGAPVQNGSRTFSFQVTGVDPPMADIWALNVEEVRWLEKPDTLSYAYNVVRGSEAKEKLFSGMEALGQTIRIKGVSFQVVGVLKARMQEADADNNGEGER